MWKLSLFDPVLVHVVFPEADMVVHTFSLLVDHLQWWKFAMAQCPDSALQAPPRTCQT